MSGNRQLKPTNESVQKFAACLQACEDCKKVCDECNAAIIAGSDVKALLRCFMLNRDCALFCHSAALLLEHGSEFLQPLLLLCGHACSVCAEESARHSLGEFQRAAQACQHCAEECQKLTGETADETMNARALETSTVCGEMRRANKQPGAVDPALGGLMFSCEDEIRQGNPEDYGRTESGFDSLVHNPAVRMRRPFFGESVVRTFGTRRRTFRRWAREQWSCWRRPRERRRAHWNWWRTCWKSRRGAWRWRTSGIQFRTIAYRRISSRRCLSSERGSWAEHLLNARAECGTFHIRRSGPTLRCRSLDERPCDCATEFREFRDEGRELSVVASRDNSTWSSFRVRGRGTSFRRQPADWWPFRRCSSLQAFPSRRPSCDSRSSRFSS